MEEIELNEISSDVQNSSQKLERVKLEPTINYICWICVGEKGVNKLKIMCHPCKCTGRLKFVHVKCLEKSVNNEKSLLSKNDFCCPFCQVRYPLELKHISLLSYCRKALCRENYWSFIFYFILSVYLIIGLIIIVYISMLYLWDLNNWYISIITLLGMFFCFCFDVAVAILYIRVWSMSIYQFYKEYKNFQEFRVIERGPYLETEL